MRRIALLSVVWVALISTALPFFAEAHVGEALPPGNTANTLTAAAFPYTKEATVLDRSTGVPFRLTIRSNDASVLLAYDPAAFTVETETVPVAAMPTGASTDPPAASRAPDNTTVHPTIWVDVRPADTSSAPSYNLVKVLPPETQQNGACYSICLVYTYALYEVHSAVVYSNTCGGGTVDFLHRHCACCSCGDHGLFSTSFTSCTYAYDCYAGHSIDKITVCGAAPPGSGWPVYFYLWTCAGRC